MRFIRSATAALAVATVGLTLSLTPAAATPPPSSLGICSDTADSTDTIGYISCPHSTSWFYGHFECVDGSALIFVDGPVVPPNGTTSATCPKVGGVQYHKRHGYPITVDPPINES